MALVAHARLGDDVAINFDVLGNTITGVSARNGSARDVRVTFTNALGFTQTVVVGARTSTTTLTVLTTSLGDAAGLRVGVGVP